MNELICETETDTDIRIDLWLPGGSCGRGVDWEFGINRCTLLHITWITDKVLPYSTENYIQYLIIDHNGKEYAKE